MANLYTQLLKSQKDPASVIQKGQKRPTSDKMANLYTQIPKSQKDPAYVIQKGQKRPTSDTMAGKKYREIHSIYDWYHPDQTEESAKTFLEEYPYDPMDQQALFLVHPYGKHRDDIKYVISCKWRMMIYQYRVRYKEEEGVYSVRSAKASNLLDLVEQYRLAAVGKDGITSIYTKETALSHLMYPIQWPHKYKDWCYHGLLGRNEAEGVLRESFQKSKLNSPFLIRDSYSDPGRLIVSSMFVKKSDESHKFDHRLINFTDNTFEALTCKGANLQALAKSIEERYRHRGDLMDLKVTYREGVHGVDTGQYGTFDIHAP